MRILYRVDRADLDENWNGKIIDAARKIGAMDGEIVGYLVIGMFENGAYSMGSRIDTERCPIPLTLLPSYLADVVRRDLINDTDVHRIIDDEYLLP